VTTSVQLNCPKCGSTRTVYFDHLAQAATVRCPRGCDGNGNSAVGLLRDERGQYDPMQMLMFIAVLLLIVFLVVYVVNHT